jgi:hypothetical protein
MTTLWTAVCGGLLALIIFIQLKLDHQHENLIAERDHWHDVATDRTWEPYAPRRLDGWASCKDALENWDKMYRESFDNTQAMTKSGFRSPVRPSGGPNGIMLWAPPGSTLEYKFDWEHPIGFVVVDCDNHVYMLDGKLELRLRWDTSRSCLAVVP